MYYAIVSYNLKNERCVWDIESEDWVPQSRVFDDGVSTNLGCDKSFAESMLRQARQRQFQMTTPRLISYE